MLEAECRTRNMRPHVDSNFNIVDIKPEAMS